jgi:hypothetical protein
MKVTCLSILLLVTSAVAFPNGVVKDDRRRTRGVPGNNRALMTGEKPEKGSKGMKGKGMKGMGKKGCQTLTIKSPLSDVEGGFSKTAVGSTLTFPVYEYYTGELIGTYTKSSTDIFVGGEFADCTITGSYNLGFDDSLEYPFVSQIMLSGTCLGTTNAITGGTGKYACAAGSGNLIDGGEDFFAAELTICNTCA